MNSDKFVVVGTLVEKRGKNLFLTVTYGDGMEATTEITPDTARELIEQLKQAVGV